jgi:hypothetical protein
MKFSHLVTSFAIVAMTSQVAIADESSNQKAINNFYLNKWAPGLTAQEKAVLMDSQSLDVMGLGKDYDYKRFANALILNNNERDDIRRLSTGQLNLSESQVNERKKRLKAHNSKLTSRDINVLVESAEVTTLINNDFDLKKYAKHLRMNPEARERRKHFNNVELPAKQDAIAAHYDDGIWSALIPREEAELTVARQILSTAVYARKFFYERPEYLNAGKNKSLPEAHRARMEKAKAGLELLNERLSETTYSNKTTKRIGSKAGIYTMPIEAERMWLFSKEERSLLVEMNKTYIAYAQMEKDKKKIAESEARIEELKDKRFKRNHGYERGEYLTHDEIQAELDAMIAQKNRGEDYDKDRAKELLKMIMEKSDRSRAHRERINGSSRGEARPSSTSTNSSSSSSAFKF